ncbi:MAG TPA: hypothetical protein VKE51_02485 [Vicinamibacterales bacterium]|nr:hypothetical protein [Vicinamibacterales bacterium]
MPPRFAYWTILIDNKPTAFRARDRQELLPTIAQLKRTNEHVDVKWFARGRLWESPDAQHAAERGPRQPREKRDRDWRPGGQHKDPRARFDKEAQRRKKREQRANWNPSRPPVGSDRDRGAAGSPPPRADRPRRDKPGGSPRGARPWKDRPPRPPRDQRPTPDREWRGGERAAHQGTRPRREPWRHASGGPPRGDRKPWQKPADRPRGDRPKWTEKPQRGGERPWRKRKDEPPDDK